MSLESILCTEELHRRPARAPDYATENRALVALAQALANAPRTILQTLTDTILTVFEAHSAGLSLLSKDEQSFFWPAVSGLWQAHVGGGTPRNFGPCGDVLDCNAPLLFKRVERRYPYFLAATPPAEECLLVPFYVEGRAVGTIWAVAHDARRKFDAEDLRQLESLGRFASAAYLATDALSAAYRALFESIDEGFCIIERVAGEADEPLDFRFIEANPAFSVQSGIIGVVGRTLRQVIPDEFEEWLLTYDAVLRTGEPIRFERGLVNQGRVLELHAFRVEDDTHRRVAVRFIDITESKRAEEQLRLNRDTFLNLIENAPFGLYIVDSKFRLRHVSTAAQKVFSHVRPLIGRDFDEVLRTVWADPFASEALGRFRHTLETGAPYAAPNTIQQRSDIADIESYDWKIERITLPDGQFGVACYFYDITERQNAEAALRASEEFNRSIIDSSPDCIKVLDLKGNLLSMHNGQALLGIEDIRPYLNKSWIALWEGGDRQAAGAAVEAAAAGREGRFVGFFRTLRDEAKWWDVTISPMLDANEKPARLLAVSRDVTERKRAETNFEFLASVSQDLAKLTDMNEAMATVGATIGVHLGLSACSFVQINESADEATISHDWHGDDMPSLVGVHRLADFVGADFIRTARAGEIIVVRDTVANPLTDTAKFAALRIASFVCVPIIQDEQWRFAMCLYYSATHDWREGEIELARELTARVWTRMERLRAEEALRQSEERYRNLFNSMDEGFCIIELILDEDGEGVDYRCLEVNPAFEKQTGISNALGKRMREIAPDQQAYGIEYYNRVVSTGEPVRFVNELHYLNRWFDIYAFRIGGPDSLKVAVIFNNITDRLQAERALSEGAETLADLDRRKDEFLAMLSHELRNPLAPISNAVKLLQLQKNQDPIQQQARTIIERQVGTLKHLVDDLLEISRINTGRIQLRRERIVVSGVVERAVETVRPLIVQRQHELTLSVSPQPLWLHADAARLEQVVVNLLTNAAKYTDEGGHLRLSLEQEGDTAVLRVRDTGIGIAPELLPRIFDLFTQAERSLDRAQGGLGIGLCLVQRLVDLHDGTVDVYSVLGQGSEFVVRLPVMLDSMAPLPLPSPSIETAALPGKPHRVLVVDDNVDAAQSLAMLLQAFGHDVRLAYDGPAAVEAALDFRPDMMLLDIGLPGLSGLEVARRIRQHPKLESIVLVAMTGYGLEADRQRSKDAGFDQHLVKPADFDQVQKILASVADKRGVAID